MLNNDVLNLLGLVSRARQMVTGDVLLKAIRQGQVKLVIIAQDASDNTKKKYQDKCSFYNIECIVIGNIDQISQAIGKDNRVAIGIKDKGFADKIKFKIGGRVYGKKEYTTKKERE